MTTVEVSTGIGLLVVSPLNIVFYPAWQVLTKTTSPFNPAKSIYSASLADVTGLLRFIPLIHESLLPVHPLLTRLDMDNSLTLGDLHALKDALYMAMNYRAPNQEAELKAAADESEADAWRM